MAHLGDRVVALVDGQLPADAADRACAHLAGCRPCREAVEAERLMKARLASLRGPQPGDDLMQRLLAMGGPNGPLPPRSGHVPGTPRPQAVALPRTPVPVTARTPVPAAGSTLIRSALVASGPVSDRPTGRRRIHAGRRGPGGATGPGRGRARRRTRLAVAVFGALSVVGVGITTLAANGAATGTGTSTITPPVDTFVVDHARTTADLPFVDVPAGWTLVRSDQGGGADR